MTIKEITAPQLREYFHTRHEKEYLLVDVRQPGEYRNGHIPGARLIPLPELVQHVESLPVDKELVFYCHSGGRSAAAATLTAEELGESRGIYNLVGGIMGWDGAILEDQPRIAVFADHTLPAMIQTAMNLEKGALRFYTGAWQRYKDQPWTKILELLAQAETGHARILFRFHPKAKADEISFDELFDGLSGEILEGGMRLTDALASLPPPQGRACLATIELALKIENSAYDLYRVMANATHAAEAADAFITLAQAEKAHMQYLIEAIGKCKS